MSERAPQAVVATIVAAGFTPADATRWVREAAAMLPLGADPAAWLPDPGAFAMTAVIDEATVQDARIDWYVNAPLEFKLLLDDLGSGTRDVGLGETVFYDPLLDVDLFNPNHEPAGSPIGGRFASASGATLIPSAERVWTGERQPAAPKLSKLKTGALGEEIAMQVLSKQFGADFRTMNTGLNNSPIDVAGDHRAVEVKTGLASNGKSAQQWRATIGQPGEAEAALLQQMTAKQKRAHNARKAEAILARKQALLDQMSQAIGAPVQPLTVGIIMTPDGKRADVWAIPGFHLRIGWNTLESQHAVHYLGTWEVPHD